MSRSEMPSSAAIPTLKLTYFNITGLAEPIRLAFTIGGINFEDERLEMDKFESVKASLPFGSLPILTIDGKRFSQSGPILRYAGKITKLYPTNTLEQLKVDEIIDGFNDLWSACHRAMYGPDSEATKAKIANEAITEAFPRYLGGIEKMIPSDAKYFLGNNITIADLKAYSNINNMKKSLPGFTSDMMKPFPKLQSLLKNVASNDKVASWEASH